MKQKHLKRALSLAIILAILTPILPTVSYAALTEEDFNRELVKLVQADDTDSYFDSMELTIGSRILTVDGEDELLDVAPIAKSNRTMLPIRAVAENAGAAVDYEAASSTVVITNDYGDEIRCPVGETTMTVNNTAYTLDVAAYADTSKGRTYLPVRAVAEALNLEVNWDQETSTVTLTAPYQTSRILVWTDQLDTSALGAKTSLYDGSGLWILQFNSPGEAKGAAEALNNMGVIAEPDRYITFEEPIEGATSADAGQGHYTWGAADCHFDEFVSAHSKQFKRTGVVAVVDTGVDTTHPFLKGKVLSGYDYVDGDNTPNDGDGHGTHVAGTILDCAGDAPVKILPLRVFDDNRALPKPKKTQVESVICTAIRYAADRGADVINLSLGGGEDKSKDMAISYAVSKGSLVVVSAGNYNTNTAYYCPAHMTTAGVVIVSAGDKNHNKAYFSNGKASNFGDSVDLMAPGLDVKASIPGGRYDFKSGTSMAAPHVSAAAVLIDMATDKTLTPAALERKVRSATTNRGVWKDQQYGCGFLDLSQADISGETIHPGISLSNSSISLEEGQSRTLTATVTPSGTGISWSSSDTEVAVVSGGMVTAVGPGTATVTAKIVYGGNTYQAKCSVTVTAKAVEAGISLSDSSISLETGQSRTLTATVTPSGTKVNWSSSDTEVATVSNGKITAVGPGTATVTAKIVYDGNTYTAKCGVTVSAPTPPAEPSDWTETKLPEKAGYRVETKEQYRSRSKELTESTQRDLDGWTLYDSKTATSWGEWSEWKDGSIFNAGSNTQVETRETPGNTTVYYNLYCYKYWNAAAGAWYYSYSSSNGGTKYTAKARASDCVPYQSFDGHQAYSYNGFDLWWVESTSSVTIQNPQYRTRSKVETTTYYYYRWGNWSSWQDAPLTADSGTEVETRTLYRYVPAS